jgi:hypothetical protein
MECADCPGGTLEATVFVRDDEPVDGYTSRRDSSAVYPIWGEMWDRFPDVDGLLALVKASDEKVSYDPQLGFPLAVETPEGRVTNVRVVFDLDEARDELAAARARWMEEGTDSYTVSYEQSTQVGSGDYLVVVREREAQQVWFRALSEEAGRAGPPHTVEDLFAVIERSLAEGMARFTFDYHATGYPETVEGVDRLSDHGFRFRAIIVDPDMPGPLEDGSVPTLKRWEIRGEWSSGGFRSVGFEGDSVSCLGWMSEQEGRLSPSGADGLDALLDLDLADIPMEYTGPPRSPADTDPPWEIDETTFVFGVDGWTITSRHDRTVHPLLTTLDRSITELVFPLCSCTGTEWIEVTEPCAFSSEDDPQPGP